VVDNCRCMRRVLCDQRVCSLKHLHYGVQPVRRFSYFQGRCSTFLVPCSICRGTQYFDQESCILGHCFGSWFERRYGLGEICDDPLITYKGSVRNYLFLRQRQGLLRKGLICESSECSFDVG